MAATRSRNSDIYGTIVMRTVMRKQLLPGPNARHKTGLIDSYISDHNGQLLRCVDLLAIHIGLVQAYCA